ncbi:MAG: hypothetical protein M0P73_02640 [Syntrophobacterales bacterium]|jgi:hypothetical protein|nr:hypothetical protein [Syntrophobacterales bacterium]
MNKQDEKKDQIIRELNETRDYNQKSLDEMKKAFQFLPYLNEANDIIDKEIEAINQVPSSYFDDFPPEASGLIEANKAIAFEYYGKVHPMYTSVSSMTTSTSAAFSGAMSVSNWLDNNKYLSIEIDNAAKILGNTLSDKVIKDKIEDEIKQLLGKLLRPEHNIYNNILEEIRIAKLDIQRIEGVVFLMRTLLEKIKGELKLKLRNQIGITRNKILPAIAEEFIDDNKSSSTYHTYMLLIAQYKTFASKLSDIGKLNIKDSDGIDKLEIEFGYIIRSLLLPLGDKL